MKRLITVVLAMLVAGMVYAAPHSSNGMRVVPATSSSSGAKPHSTSLDRSVHAFATNGHTTYYGAPFYDDYAYHNDGHSDSVGAALDKWWAQYQHDWAYAFPGCSYSSTSDASGSRTGHFASFHLHGTCGGGGNIYGTAYPYKPGKNNGCAGGCQAGDPINLGTGNEYEDQEDYATPGSMRFDRHYNSSPSAVSTHIGAHWRDNYDRHIEYLGGSATTATVFRPDGKNFQFQKVNGAWTPDPDVHDTLLENDDSQGHLAGWTYFVAGTQQIETYNAGGLLTSIEDLNGQTTTLTYSDATTSPTIAPVPGLLITVTDPRDRQLHFVYGAHRRITQITLPDGGTLAYAYDGVGNLTQVTYPDGHARIYKYDENSNAPSGFPHLLTGIIDENGHRFADIHYDSQRRATSSQLGGIANRVQVAYHANTTTVTWPLGAQSTLGLTTPLGRMRVSSNSQPCGPSCNQTAALQTYDANGNLKSRTDFNGVTTAYTFDTAGLETQRIEAQGTPVERTINTRWDAVWRNPLERTRLDASGKLTAKTDWVYNSRGQVLARCKADPTVLGATGYTCTNTGTPPAGVRRWTYTYCDAVGGQCPLVGLLLSVDGPRIDVADVVQYVYYTATDESGCGTADGTCHRAGDLWKITDALGHVTEMAIYDRAGRPTEVIDPNGVVTAYTYTPRGWLHTRTVAGATTTIDYDAVGDVVRIIQPDGVFNTYVYDAAHRLIGIGDALGNHIDFTLDAVGNRIAENTYATGSSTPSRSLSRIYNNLGELVKSLDAYGHASSYTYDAAGNRTGVTNALSVTTHESYDALSRLSQTVRNYLGTDSATANATTTYAYDSRDNVSQIIDPDGLATHYDHNGLSELSQLLSPDTGTTDYTYDAAGNRISKTDARGIVSTYTYDVLNRLTSVSYPTQNPNTYYYDEPGAVTGCTHSYPLGRLTRMVDSSGSTTYCYDAHGNVTRKQQVVAAKTYTTTYTYNVAERLMGIGYPAGAHVAYTRDADGRVASVTTTSATGVTNAVVTAISYLPFGPASNYTFGNGQTQTKTFDHDYRPTGVVSTPFYLQYTLDAIGNPVALKDAAGQESPVEGYHYDPLNRLQQVDDAGSPWQSYTYNKTGDRLTKTTAGIGTDAYSYQSSTHRLIGITGAEPSARMVDANGNTISLPAADGTYTLNYDDSNRLTLVQQSGVAVMSYAINGKGERVRKTAMTQSQHGCKKPHKRHHKHKHLKHNHHDKHCVPTAGAVTDFVYDGFGKLLGEYTADINRAYVWAGNTLVATIDNPAQGSDAIHYVYTDNLGTPRVVTTQTGTTVWSWSNIQNPFGGRPTDNYGYILNLRYPGQYHDGKTGLNYNYFRDYESATGRYSESDPLGLTAGVSTYAYVGNDPINHIDSWGLDDTMCMYNPSSCGGGVWNQSPVNINASIGISETGAAAIGLESTGFGFAADSTPNICFYATTCGSVGAGGGMYRGAGVDGSVGTGALSNGDSYTAEAGFGGGEGGSAGGSLQYDPAGHQLSAGRGFLGVGEGVWGGLMMCRTHYSCVRKPKPKPKPKPKSNCP